jgi:beta-carotene 3-hydroxylase
VTPALLFVAAFVAMEGVSYAGHRWVMHGPGMGWHRSHHAPPEGRFERNDRFPLCFSVVGFLLFLFGSLGLQPLWWIGAGVTAYGAAYLFVHEVYIHRRLSVPLPNVRYLEWLRAAHRDHHTGGAEPYGMLLPVVRGRSSTRERAIDPIDRGVHA